MVINNVKYDTVIKLPKEFDEEGQGTIENYIENSFKSGLTKEREGYTFKYISEPLSKEDYPESVFEPVVEEAEEDEELEDVKVEGTKRTNLSIIDSETVLNHINREEIKRDYFRYYLEVEYYIKEFVDGFVTKVSAWVKYKSIKQNGKIESEGVSIVDIPLGEEDKLYFDSEEEAVDYLELISKEDSTVTGTGEKNGNRYIYFKSKNNDEIFKEEIENWESFYKDLQDSGELNNYMTSKGFKVKNPVKPKEDKEVGEGKGLEIEEDKSKQLDKNGYYHLGVDEAINGLRDLNLAIKGVNRYVDTNLGVLRDNSVTDIALKNVKFEYDWESIEGISGEVSQSIIMYYDFELLGSQGLYKDTYALKFLLSTIIREGKPYLTKEDFGDLIVKTDNIIKEIKNKGYTSFLYKGITLYIGKVGLGEYKTYLKENDIEDKPMKPKGESEEGEVVRNKKDAIELIKREYKNVHQTVNPDRINKSVEMLNAFLVNVNNRYRGKNVQIQFANAYKGVSNVVENGSLLGIETQLDGSKNKGEVLVLHPYFIIAMNGEGLAKLVYRKERTNMSLIELENMLVTNGYESLRGISRALNLRNYSKHRASNNGLSKAIKRGIKSEKTRVVNNAVRKGVRSTGRFLIGKKR